MPKLIKRLRLEFIVVAIIFGAIIPKVCNVAGMSAATKQIWILVVLNFIVATVIGFWAKKVHAPWLVITFMPILFALSNFIFHINNHQYAYYLALTYLALSAFGRFSGTRVEVDTDDDNIPDLVEGGFKSNID
ncbi:hypothetical protein EQG49_12940 [Periweissella cryptocerci]|uniref:Uncharacterized protein n=1 Tax=Periweissella cryptocerci TaxID=2506420 RepID=A0A4P6YWR4_9LACO|nr:hypothetical protein [Periweissella cryptocerci]QBO37302.1 hypothetical protein EQG49_12940 [Periweissella cryptocerci]